MGLKAALGVLSLGGLGLVAYVAYVRSKQSTAGGDTGEQSTAGGDSWLQSAGGPPDVSHSDEHPANGIGAANEHDVDPAPPEPSPLPVLTKDSPPDVLAHYGLTYGGYPEITDDDYAPAVKISGSDDGPGVYSTYAIANPVSVFHTPEQARAALKVAQTIYRSPDGFVGVGVREEDAF